MKKLNLDEAVCFLKSCGPDTKLYLGCDSERIVLHNEPHIDYTLALVVHIDGCHGCKIFGEVVREKMGNAKLKEPVHRPYNRLFDECVKVSELYNRLIDALILADMMDFADNIEVHLDLNPSEMHGSNCATSSAIGYVKAVCGSNVVTMIKPDAWAASYAADRLKHVLDGQLKLKAA